MLRLLLFSFCIPISLIYLYCYILLERHYFETISFVTSCFVVHEERLYLRVVFPLGEYCFSDYCLWLAILPYFAVHAATTRMRSLFHNNLLFLLLSPIIYPILEKFTSAVRETDMSRYNGGQLCDVRGVSEVPSIGPP